MTSYFQYFGASLVAQTVKNLPAVQESWVQSLGWKDPLEKGTHCSILAWRIPRTEEPNGLPSIGWQRVWPDWATFFHFYFIIIFKLFIYFTLHHCIGFAIHWHESAMGVHVFPILNPSLLPPHPIFLGHPITPAPGILYHASNLDWWFISHMIIYMFQCHSPISPSPSPSEAKRLFNTSVSLLLSRIQGYHYHLIYGNHIYVLVYWIGVFLSGLLHSV